MQTKTILIATLVASATLLAQDTPRREQALLEDLALANRIVARQLGILDIQGHVTARSRTNPNTYYIARFVSPGGASVGDFVENTLESVPVDGPRNDQAREIYLHGEIYKARPDVMAVVHAHAPEFVSFGMSSVPLWDGDQQVPVWDIRPFNKGRSGIVNTPALGKAMAEKMGKAPAVLLWGHGIALGAASLSEAVNAVDALRDTAQLQQSVISLGATWKPEPKPRVDRNAVDRAWEFHKRVELKRTGGKVPQAPESTPARPADAAKAAAHDVMLANRILTGELGILDSFGHVSMRHPGNPNAYFMAISVAPGAVTAGDVREWTMGQTGGSGRVEIHDEIYKANPQIRAILFARTPEVMAFAKGAPALRPIVNGGNFISASSPQFKGDGYILTAGSIYNLVDRAYQLRQNAIVQRQTIALRGRVAYLDERPAEPVSPNEPQAPAPTGPPEGRAWIYWSQNVSID
jgi:ribulose-5-phosphate 4-epimerase/fuculose-1-phosphate aldolase